MPIESTAIPATAGGGATTTFNELHADVLTSTLRLLDGPSLAAASCATSHLRSLFYQSDLWLHLCLSTWPSLLHPRLVPLLSASPRSFFADAFPFPSPVSAADEADLPGELISAVDLYHRGVPVLSRVIETDTSSPWFLGSPFRIEALDRKAAAVLPEELTLSWIVIDPARGRAVNVSSRRAVAVERHWYTGETVVRFAGAVVAGGCVVGAIVTCEEWTGQVREVALTAEDMNGACASGIEGLRAVSAAMEAGRRGRGMGAEEEEVKKRYLEYVRRKRRRKESRARRERMVDLCCSAVGAAVFFAFLLFIVFR